MTFLAEIGDSLKAITVGGKKIDSPGYSGGSNTGYGGYGGLIAGGFYGNHSPGAKVNYAAEVGELRLNTVVAACIVARYKAISAAPPYLAQRKGDKWERVDEHPLSSLLRVPNGFYGSNALWGATEASTCTTGNGFWRINWLADHSLPAEILWEHSATPLFDDQSFVREYRVMTGGLGAREQLFNAATNFDWNAKKTKDTFRPAIVHFRHMLDPHNPRNGTTPLLAGLRQVYTGNSLATMHAALARNSGMPSWAITPAADLLGVAGLLTTSAIEYVKNQFKRLTTGENAGNVIATNEPVNFQKLSLSPDEMSSDKIRSSITEDICALLQTPAMVIGMSTGANSTYANYEQALTDFWHRTILPEMEERGDEIESQIFPLYRDLNRDDWRIQWDTSQIEALKESEDSLFTRISVGLNKAAFLTVNEARAKANLPAIDGGDALPTAPPEQEPEEAEAKSMKQWNEADHPRVADGEFGSGSGSSVTIKDDGSYLSAETKGGMVGGSVSDGALTITHAHLPEEEQGKGYGKAMYRALIDHAHDKGLQVFSDSTVEMPAVRVYESLRREGYDVVRQPGGGELPPDEDIPFGALYGADAEKPVFEIKPKMMKTVEGQPWRKTLDQPEPLPEWTDAELDAMTADLTDEDVARALGTRTPAMRALLQAKEAE